MKIGPGNRPKLFFQIMRKNYSKSFGNIKNCITFAFGLRLQPDAPGRFPDKNKDYEYKF